MNTLTHIILSFFSRLRHVRLFILHCEQPANTAITTPAVSATAATAVAEEEEETEEPSTAECEEEEEDELRPYDLSFLCHLLAFLISLTDTKK